MSALDDIKARAEVNQYVGQTASQDEAKATLKLVAALEVVEAIAAELRGTDIHPDGDMFSQGWDRSAIWAGESIRNAINEALEGAA